MKHLAVLVALFSAQAATAPTVFVGVDRNNAWYISQAKARPMGKSIDAIGVAAVNSYRQQNWPAFQPFCYLDALDRASFAGTDRKTQLDIETTFKAFSHDAFRQSFSTLDGRQFRARVGLAEECDTATIATVVIVYDAQSGSIENMLEWAETPFRFLWPGDANALVYHSSCFECGDINALNYDAARRRFYWESQGD